MINQTVSLVSAPQQDQRNVGLRAAESLGYFSLGHRATQRSDGDDFFGGQELLEAQAEVHVDGVLFVHPIIDPLKIRGGRVRFDAVHVIDERKIERIGDEGESDEAMHIDRLSFCISPQDDLRVSDFIDAGFEDLTIDSAGSLKWVRVCTDSIKASDSTKTADFVKTMKVGDSSPFLVNHYVGLLARSAHFTVVSSINQGGIACPSH